MTFNDIVHDHKLVYTSQAKQIILDTIAQHPYMTLAQIFAVWAGIQNTQEINTLRYIVPPAALYYPPTQKQESKELQLNDIYNQENIDLAAPYMNENQGAVSETLANIFIAQQKYNQAIEVYEQLCLKNPQKSVYFANRIAEIKTKINNTNE